MASVEHYGLRFNKYQTNALAMDGEAGLVSGCNLRVENWSYQHFMREEEQLEEPGLDSEEYRTKSPNKELYGFSDKRRQHYGKNETEPDPDDSESSDFIPAYQACEQPNQWGIRKEEERSQSCMLEYWVYLDNQPCVADCPGTRPVTPPSTPLTYSPCPVTPAASHVSATTLRNAVSPLADTCSPSRSSYRPTTPSWDSLRATFRSPSRDEWDPVRAAAHLHLLGESLSLIGLHLQATNKLVNMSSGFSLLLDSLLCALPPLMCLTAEIPELSSCTQHTLASTLENIAYVMPGM